MERKFTLGIVALAMIALLGIGAVSAFGFGGMASEEDREAMREAVEAGDYEAWSSLKKGQITEERFNAVRERHAEREAFRAAIEEARDSGDWEEVQQLKDEFGMGKGQGKRNQFDGECPFADKD